MGILRKLAVVPLTSIVRKFLLPVGLVLATLSFCSRSDLDLEQYVIRGSTMGTSYTVKIVKPEGSPFDQTLLANEIDSLLQDVNQIMSTYIDNSELSQLNAAPAGEWIPLSDDLYQVLHVAQTLSEKSGGAFDITIGPLVNLWGFGPEHNQSDIPPDEDIAERQQRIGFEHIELREQPPAIRKNREKMYIDLSAIAKGWGVDQVAEYIEAATHFNYLVEIGGEIRARGVNAKNQPWRIGVSSPDTQFLVQKVIDVQDRGVATSGDYRNYFEKDGVRYSHTIDPRTGRPISHNLVSVTVVHPQCMMADAYATTIDVMGPDSGLELAEQENLPVFLIVKTDDGFEEQMTSSFKHLIQR